MFDTLGAQNWAVSNDILSAQFCEDLARECQLLNAEGRFQKAAIGFGQSKTNASDIRGDSTFWLDTNAISPAQRMANVCLADFLGHLNQSFFLGLKRFEAHFAHYPPGTGYEKHVDNHLGANSRKITFIIYLNKQWQEGHGGELSLYSSHDENILLKKIEPRIGTMVLFRSELFPHQVEKSLQPRLSLTGWFRDDAL